MRTWWHDTRPYVWREAAGFVVLVLTLWLFTTYWREMPPWALLLIMLPIVGLNLVGGRAPRRFAALADGAFINVSDAGDVAGVPLATATLRTTPQGATLDWEDEPSPTPLALRGFPALDLLEQAIQTARTGGDPSTSRELARRLQVVPVLTPHRWVRPAYATVFFLGYFAIRWWDLSILLLLPGALMAWLDSLSRQAPWAAVTLQGLWVLPFNQEPVWIPLSEITAIHRKWGGLDSLIHTTDASFPTLALGIRTRDLRRLLPAPAARMEGPKPM